MKRGQKFTPEQRERLSRSHMGQPAWNKGTGGCKKGHDPSLYITPGNGVPICVACRRKNAAGYRQKNRQTINLKNRVARYGMSVDQLKRMLIEQNHACAICHVLFLGKKYRIDHDHNTGAVRGILCHSCNTAIGLLQDSPENALSAHQYLASRRKRGD